MPASRDFGLGCAHIPVATDPKTDTLITIPVPILGYCRGCSNKTGENLVAIPEWHRVNLPPDAREVYDEAPFYGGEYGIDSAAATVDDTSAAGASAPTDAAAAAGAPASATELSSDTAADDATPAAAAAAAADTTNPSPNTTTTPNRIKYLSTATLEATYTYPATFIAIRQAWNHEFSTEAVALELSGITKQPLDGCGVLVGMGGVETEHAGPSYERGWGAEGDEGGGEGVGVGVSTREQARVNGVKRMLDVWAGQAQFHQQMGRGVWAGEGGEESVGGGGGEEEEVGVGVGVEEGEGEGEGGGEQETGTITIGYAGE